MPIKIDIIGGDLEQVVRDIEAQSPAARRALIRAVRRVTRSASSQAARDVAKRSKVPVRALRESSRVFTRLPANTQRDKVSGSVWLGQLPLPARYIGALSQTPTGARAGRYRFEGAFVAQMRSGLRSVFRRVRKSRLPIKQEAVALTVAEPVMRQIERASRARLRDVLIRELNFELNVKGNR
jgi:plasmid stabilization system protein ParE